MLRPYQQSARDGIRKEWDRGARNALAVLPTGAGKTVVFAHMIREHAGPCCAVAHRQELVTQISLALAREGVRHRIIGPSNVIKLAVAQHTEELGTSYFDPSAQCAVAGVDTLRLRGDALARWLPTVTLWVQDEAHHVLRRNKWGAAVEMFPNARGLGVTATPLRADGRGLGRHADGVFDAMVVGPNMRELIRAGYLTDYRIFAPPSDLDLSDVTVGASGDYTQPTLSRAVKRSHIVGDVVTHYKRIAPGRLGVTFTPDVETATNIAAQFNASGVPAEVVSAKTPNEQRVAILRRFRNRELLQLVNVDLFGEGFDLPAIEVVSMARPTQSYGLYCQQFGRALRILKGKDRAIIIDHVGNAVRHGLPDRARPWTLDARERRQVARNAEPLRVCPGCTGVYERALISCPYCGYVPVPAVRSGPEFVDGDLHELDAATLEAMRGEVERVDQGVEDYRAGLRAKNTPQTWEYAHVARHAKRQEAQGLLREAMQWWAGAQERKGRGQRESYRRFYHKFGVDVLGAQALGTRDAAALADRVYYHMGEVLCEI